jgi:hypothetical protein
MASNRHDKADHTTKDPGLNAKSNMANEAHPVIMSANKLPSIIHDSGPALTMAAVQRKTNTVSQSNLHMFAVASKMPYVSATDCTNGAVSVTAPNQRHRTAVGLLLLAACCCNAC